MWLSTDILSLNHRLVHKKKDHVNDEIEVLSFKRLLLTLIFLSSPVLVSSPSSIPYHYRQPYYIITSKCSYISPQPTIAIRRLPEMSSVCCLREQNSNQNHTEIHSFHMKIFSMYKMERLTIQDYSSIYDYQGCSCQSQSHYTASCGRVIYKKMNSR